MLFLLLVCCPSGKFGRNCEGLNNDAFSACLGFFNVFNNNVMYYVILCLCFASRMSRRSGNALFKSWQVQGTTMITFVNT